MQLLLNFPVNKCNTYLQSKQEKNWENMTSFNQPKNNFLLLLFHLIILYFVRERFHLSIGIYISMKSTFLSFNYKAQKNGKNIKIFLTKTKQKKLTSNNKNKNNKKRIRMFLFATTRVFCAVLSNNKLSS